MKPDLAWGGRFALDVQFGFLGRDVTAPKQHHPQVVLNATGNSVLRTLREELSHCSAFTFSVAFVSPRAIALLKQELVEFEGEGRIVTSDYLSFNSPQAFAELQNLNRLDIDVRLHASRAFHPKGYVFEHADGVTAIVGSSNLTESALVTNHEWNLKVSAATDSDLAAQVATLVQDQVAESVPLTEEWIHNYSSSYHPPPRRSSRRSDSDTIEPDAVAPASGVGTDLLERETDLESVVDPGADEDAVTDSIEPATTPKLKPNAMQREALQAIALARSEGNQRAVIVSATGTGKTMLSALDVREFNPQRMLFVAHREQILDRTIREYQRVLEKPDSDFGKLTGNVKQPDAPYLFATVQTLSQPDVISGFASEDFDYIVIDEAHRAGASSHLRVIDYFEPKFLLGMTATPERTDAFNVFELFHYVVPYEIRLNDALEADMLSPFHYYGIADVAIDGGIRDATDLRLLTSARRIDHIVAAIETYGQAGSPPRGLIFCSRRDEARELSSELNERELRGKPLRTVALTGEDSVAFRESMVERLENGELDYILTVDVFNEGVDIPSINQVIMLRQTKSSIVFVQQLGRGLRKSEGKEYLVVIDFIGNYTNNYLIPIALFGDESLNKESLRKSLIAAEEKGVIAGLSSVRFDRISQRRILSSIVDTSLDSMPALRSALHAMRNRLGGIPRLYDFLRFESVDPVVLATKRENYPALVASIFRIESGLSLAEHKALCLLSHEVLTSKRMHEFVLLHALLNEGSLSLDRVRELFDSFGLPASTKHVTSAIDTLTLERHAEADQRRYGNGLAERVGQHVALNSTRTSPTQIPKPSRELSTTLSRPEKRWSLIATGLICPLQQGDSTRERR